MIERRKVENTPLVTLFEIELFQRSADKKITYSKLQFFIVNGIEHLASDDNEKTESNNTHNLVPKRESLPQKDSIEHFLTSQTIFKYLLSFRVLIRSLATTPNLSAVIPLYNSSTFTRLCKDAIGGNSMTLLVGLLNNGSPHCKEILDIASEIQIIKQYPIANEDCVLGLLSKFRVELRLSNSSSPMAILPMNPGTAPVLGAVRGGGMSVGITNSSSASVKLLSDEQIKELEKKIVQNQLTYVDLQQQHNHLNGQYQQLKAQFKKVLESKTEAHKKLIEAEQNKLETGKALVEVRISQQQLLKRVQQCEPELETLKKKYEQLFNEFNALKRNTTKMEQEKHQLELEHEELHVETLKLIQIKKEYEKNKNKILDMKIEHDTTVESLQTQVATLTKQKDLLFQQNKT